MAKEGDKVSPLQSFNISLTKRNKPTSKLDVLTEFSADKEEKSRNFSINYIN